MSLPQDDTQLWMVPYADLMSMLVILFMALFAYSYSTKSAELDRALSTLQLAVGSKEDVKVRERLKEAELALEMQDQVGKMGLSDMGLHVTAKRIRLTLPAPVLFAEGSEKLGEPARPALEAVARFLSHSPQPVLVEGHTDNVPIAGGRYRSNWELSAARAYSVVDYLIARGVPASRFSIRGYAEHRPAAPNDTPEGRRTNRRIEISLLRREEAEVPAR
ncbi:MAG: flagellar motor protein MotB [Elusimicrobia bacterium]|nr:flagellar motor protein MotB [Elusimicrobiota bacterium]